MHDLRMYELKRGAMPVDSRATRLRKSFFLDCVRRFGLDVTEDVRVVFEKVPREGFLPDTPLEEVYQNSCVCGQGGTPSMYPYDLLRILSACVGKQREVALVIGGGIGYSAAILSYLYTTVFCVSVDQEVVHLKKKLSLLHVSNIISFFGRLPDGLPKQGPFDLILIEGGVPQVSRILLSQLKRGGCLVAFIKKGNFLCELTQFVRTEKGFQKTSLFETVIPELEAFQEKEFVF